MKIVRNKARKIASKMKKKIFRFRSREKKEDQQEEGRSNQLRENIAMKSLNLQSASLKKLNSKYLNPFKQKDLKKTAIATVIILTHQL